MLAEAEARDAQEDSQFGAQRGDELPAALVRRGDRLARLRQCQDKPRRQAAEAASRQQEKIDARAAAEQASGKRKRGRNSLSFMLHNPPDYPSLNSNTRLYQSR